MSMSTATICSGKRRQSGAALIIGLILLLVLTLLAVSGMNSASIELVMAGNEQYQLNAFQASETGVEQVLNVPNFDATTPPVVNAAMPNSAGDQFSYNVAADANGNGFLAQDGSGSRFSMYYFQVQSTGQSARNASAVHTQGVSFLAPYDPSHPPVCNNNVLNATTACP
jgi:type IV pilus assembly protein PilX